MSTSAMEKIIKDFSEVASYFEWEVTFNKYLEWKKDILNNQWYVENIFKLPFWENFHDFTLAIQKLIEVNQKWEHSDWFNTNVFEKYRPKNHKNKKFFNVMKCANCEEEVFIIKNGSESILVNTNLLEKNSKNLNAKVISITGKEGLLKDLGNGYLKHSFTCKNNENKS